MVKVHIGTSKNKGLKYELNNLTRHAVVLGTTGSGKTVMAKVILEEAMQNGIPIIAIDPKGDLGGLAISDKGFDFRPFCGTGIKRAEKTAQLYFDSAVEQGLSLDKVDKIAKAKAKVYTPKSSVGIPVCLIPDLAAPNRFRKLVESDPNLIADFVEPISESIVHLADVRGAKKEKAQSLISSILIHNWDKQNDLDFKILIKQIINPPFEEIGSLPLDDFFNDKERKSLASSVNLILSSPTKRAWKHGEKLDVAELFSKGKLSVFDLRLTGSNTDKQFVVEQILQEIYKYLIRRGGSQKLKYILYIDELAGLLPPPPANPPSKKLLELLIRQARAFGLGIMVATQSPGDIDYRIFGNLGTRFVGKLRTERDIEKVATAMDMNPSSLKARIGKLDTGEFVYNDAVRNTIKDMKARWLFTYHKGPLKPIEIEWINNPDRIPKVSGSLKLSKKKVPSEKRESKSSSKPKVVKKKSTKAVVTSLSSKKPVDKNMKNLSELVKQVKSHADKVQMKVALSEAEEYVPHLRVVVEAKAPSGLDVEMQGPYVFDMTTHLIPIGNFLKNITFSTYISDNVNVGKHKASVKKAIDYCVRDSKDNLKSKYFRSSLLSFKSFDKDEVQKKNYNHIMETVKLRIDQLRLKETKKIKELKKKIKANSDKISKYNVKVRARKATKMLKRVFAGKKTKPVTAEMKYFEKRSKKLKLENKRYSQKISKIKKDYSRALQTLKDKAFQKAHTCVKKHSYRPVRGDMKVHASILLVPKRRHEK